MDVTILRGIYDSLILFHFIDKPVVLPSDIRDSVLWPSFFSIDLFNFVLKVLSCSKQRHIAQGPAYCHTFVPFTEKDIIGLVIRTSLYLPYNSTVGGHYLTLPYTCAAVFF